MTSTNPPRSRLDRRYVYLNPITAQVSSNTLTVRQLCRLLCPSTSSAGATPSQIFTPQLQILGLVEDDEGSNGQQQLQPDEADQHGNGITTSTPRYSPDGWTVVTATPILREACAQFYYSSWQPQDGGSRVTEGPVTCRQLAQIVSERFPSHSQRDSLMVWSPILDAIHTNNSSSNDNDIDDATAENETGNTADVATETNQRSNSTSSTGGWQKLDALPDLQTAMEAFDTTPTVAADAVLPSVATNETDSAYDPSMMMMFTAADEMTKTKSKSKAGTTTNDSEMSIQEELEAFLKTPNTTGYQREEEDDDDAEDDDNEGYESDGGTHYMKDRTTGNWIEGSLPLKSKKVTKPTKTTETPSTKKPDKVVNPAPSDTNTNDTTNGALVAQLQQQQASKKRKRPKFSAKHAKCWIYVSGLPSDTNEDEVTRFFSKVGIIALDPETQQPKVKLYRYSPQDVSQATAAEQDNDDDATFHPPRVGQLKGDASICYARPESVDLAVQILDEALFRSLTSTSTSTASVEIRVERAKFEQHGETFDERRRRLATSRTKQKVAKLAALQAMDWDDEGDVNGRISGGRKGLRIVVLKHVFDPMKVVKRKNHKHGTHQGDDDEEEEEGWELQVERHVRQTCDQFGAVEKITIFSKHPDGVVLVKFVQPSAATEAVQHYNNSNNHGGDDETSGIQLWRSKGYRKVEASYWDGVTDYTVRDEVREQQEMERRQDEFGNWLEHQELPEEFQLRVEEVNHAT